MGQVFQSGQLELQLAVGTQDVSPCFHSGACSSRLQ